MKVQLKNIAAINEANVECNGITIISGYNGSGKTSFEKAVTSVFLAVDNFINQFLEDRNNYVVSTFKRAINLFSYSAFGGSFVEDRDVQVAFPTIVSLLNNSFFNYNIEEWEKVIYSIREEISINKEKLYLLARMRNRYDDSELFKNRLERINVELYSSLNKALDDILLFLKSHNSVDDYLFNRISIQLDSAFNGQFFPKNKENVNFSSICLSNDKFYIDYERALTESLSGSKIKFDLFNAPKVYYISDSCIIDDIKNISKRRKNPYAFMSELDNIKYMSYTNKLFNDLCAVSSISEMSSNSEKYKDVLDIIAKAIDFDLRYINGHFITSDGGIDITNEASGAKLFIILKLLIQKGFIDSNTIILLDEPENHLHPEWQQLMGRCLVKMCELIGCKCFVVTHSPSFLLALDVYSKNLKNDKKFNVYFCEKNKGGVTFTDYSNDIYMVHRKLNEPYIKMDIIGDIDDDTSHY